MPTFYYEGFDTRAGKLVSDFFTTDSEAQFREHLKDCKIDLIDHKAIETTYVTESAVPVTDLMDLFASLRGTRFAAIGDAVGSYADVSRNARFVTVLRRVCDELRRGVLFPDVISQFPHVFPGWLVAIIRSHFRANEIDLAFERAHLALKRRLRRKRTYSSQMNDVKIGVSIMALFVLGYLFGLGPRLAAGVGGHIGRYKVDEGWLTKIMVLLVSISHHPVFIAMLVIGFSLYWAAPWLVKTWRPLNRWYERYLLDYTGENGRILLTEHSAMVAEQLSVLLASLSRSETLDMVARSSPYGVLKQEWSDAATAVRKGTALHDAIDEVEHMDPRLRLCIHTTRNLPTSQERPDEQGQKKEWTVVRALDEVSTNLFEEVDERTIRLVQKKSVRYRIGLIGAFLAISLVFTGPYLDTIWSSLQFHSR